MLQDMLARRPTEIEYLTGYVLQQAQVHRIQAPHIATLHALVRAKEALLVA
jgi:2-dehydropantoate 2-reductase